LQFIINIERERALNRDVRRGGDVRQAQTAVCDILL
jgi:hypothetical protein